MIMRWHQILFVTAIGAMLLWSFRYPLLQVATAADGDRVAAARKGQEAALRTRCEQAGLPYPPPRVFFRAFKLEKVLEAWGGGKEGDYSLIASYPWTATSGKPGPKRREGDSQIPEGFYRVDRFNPRSLYHLSLGINYPNAADRVHADPKAPGSDIFIHGKDASIGCIALGDPAIEQAYLLALGLPGSAPREIPVHIFPGRMDGEAWMAARSRSPELAEFWATLEPGYLAFEKSRRVPVVAVRDGSYRVEE